MVTSGVVSTPGNAVPVLLLIFRRADLVRRQIEALRILRPSRLYVAADGPRSHVSTDIAACFEARAALELVDWPCTVSRLFRETNLGLERAIPEAIDWFFLHEEEGAILEEDCIPGPDFLAFCAPMLERFRQATQVYQISGTNFQPVTRSNDASYFFSRYMHVWGWATWRRAWNQFRPDWSSLDEFFENADRVGFWENPRERLYWKKIYGRTARGETVSWANRWQFSAWADGGVCIYPEVNLVSNLGFRNDGTNTQARDALKAEKTTSSMGNLRHPTMLVRQRVADRWTFERMYWGRPVERFVARVKKLGTLARTLIRRSSSEVGKMNASVDRNEPVRPDRELESLETSS